MNCINPQYLKGMTHQAIFNDNKYELQKSPSIPTTVIIIFSAIKITDI